MYKHVTKIQATDKKLSDYIKDVLLSDSLREIVLTHSLTIFLTCSFKAIIVDSPFIAGTAR